MFDKKYQILYKCTVHRFNMELDLQSLFGLLVHSCARIYRSSLRENRVYKFRHCTHWLRPRNPLHFSRIWTLILYARLIVTQDRRHVFVTPDTAVRKFAKRPNFLETHRLHVVVIFLLCDMGGTVYSVDAIV
jgi:hypothetical protein